MAPTYLLELALDPLSDTTPTYIDITDYFLEGSYQRFGGGDLDDPSAGTATIVLDNRDRRFEPGFVAGAYYPDIKPLRRMRLSIDGDTEFSGFVRSWGPQWPGNFLNQEAVVELIDGQHLVELEALPGLDPPEATNYEEVISADQPSFYYRLGEPEGTKVVHQVRKEKYKLLVGSHVYDRKRKVKYKRSVTRAQAEGVSGPAGTYKNLPTLAEPGMILGDLSTSAYFYEPDQSYARVPLAEDDLITRNRLTMEAWVKFDGTGVGDGAIISGPDNAGAGSQVFDMYWDGTNIVAEILNASGIGGSSCLGTTTIVAGTIYHIAATWDGHTLSLYVNGSLEDTDTGTTVIASGDPDGYLFIGRVGALYTTGWIQDVAVYEKALTPERVLAHYYAGALRGWAEDTAGNRIEDILTHDLWATGSIQNTGLTVQPQMQYGQTMMEELSQTWETEKPQRVFYFSGAGNPVYLGWDFGDTAPYNTVQATFGEDSTLSEVPYESLEVAYAEDDIYNEITISRDGGEAQVSSDSDSQDEYRLRRYQQSGLILSEDTDAALIADTVIDEFKQPELVVTSMTLNGVSSTALAQIKARESGQLVRIKRRPLAGTAIDRVCRVKGKSVVIPRTGSGRSYPVATLTFTRGFDADADGTWHLGIVGFCELDGGAVLG